MPRVGYGRTQCHTHPTMEGWGTVDYNRDGEYIAGTVDAYVQRMSGSFGYGYACEITWNGIGNVYDHFQIRDNNQSWGSGNVCNRAHSFRILVGNSGGTLGLNYCCNARGPSHSWTSGYGCTNTDGTSPKWSHFGIFSTSVEAGYRTPTIGINNTTAIGLHSRPSIDSHVDANTSGDNNATTVTWHVNGRDYGASCGNSDGWLHDASHPDRPSRFRPSSAGVGDGASFAISATRRHNSNTSLVANSSSQTARTYRLPLISNLTVSPAISSGDRDLRLTWQTNSRRWETTYEKEFKTYLEMEAESWKSVETNSNPTSPQSTNAQSSQNTTIGKSYLDSHLTATQRNADVVKTKFRVRRKNISASENTYSGGNIEAVSNEVSVTFQYKPKYAATDLVFKRNDANGVVIKPRSAVIISPESSNYTPKIYITWKYPNSADRGVLNGFYVYFYDSTKPGSPVHTITVNNSSLTATQFNCTVNTSSLARARLNTIKIVPFYKRPNGTYATGPELNSDFVYPLAILDKPVITAPISYTKHSKAWINKNFRILFALPNDPDYNYYETSVKNSYQYESIQISINGTVYDWQTTPSIFSTSSLTFQKKIAVNPSLASTFPNATTYKIKVRVCKKYWFSEYYLEDKWSRWSDEVELRVVEDSFSVKRGDLIMASHYNTLRPLIDRMKACYPLPSSSYTCVTVNRGDLIRASDYTKPYNDIKGLGTAINSYASIDSNRGSVKLPTVPEFTPVVGEYITALAEDKDFPRKELYCNNA